MAMNEDVEKSDFTLLFLLSCEFDSTVNAVETLVEGLGWIRLIAVAAETRPEELTRSDGAPAIIHVYMEIVGVWGVFLLGFFDGQVDCVCHPNLRYGDH